MNKKTLTKTFMAAFLTAATIFYAQGAYAYKARVSAQTKRVPQGTIIELKMVEPVTTEKVDAGEMFSAAVVKDIEGQGSIILPVGTIIRGTVKSVKPAKRLSKSAILYLSFDHLVTASGKQIPIRAGICSNFKLTDDGAITSGGNYGWALGQNWNKTVDITKKATIWGINSGEDLFNGGKFLVTPFSATGGAIAGVAYFVGDSVIDLFRKGEDVVINQGKLFNIVLFENLDVPSN